MARRRSTPNPHLREYLILADDWLRVLHSCGRSEATRETYRYALRSLGESLSGQVVGIQALTRQDLERWLSDLRDQGRAAQTRHIYLQAVRGWCAWLVEEGILAADPCARVHSDPPSVTRTPMPTAEALQRILAHCSGRGFLERRDAALLRLLADTGLRRAEAASITLADVDWDRHLIHVTGKGAKPRTVRFGIRTRAALDAYLRVRRREYGGACPSLFLTERGRPLTGHAVYEIVRERGAAVGVTLHPHQLRHFFAHHFRSRGGSDSDLMALGGWSRRELIDRYGAVAAEERALAAHARYGPGDAL